MEYQCPVLAFSNEESLQKSKKGRVIVVTPDRIAYYGYIGATTTRMFGSLTLYISINSTFRVMQADGEIEQTDFAVVPPYTPHRVFTGNESVAAILIEPEFVDCEAILEAWRNDAGQRAQTLQLLRKSFSRLKGGHCNTACFDQMFFGYALPKRVLDHRIKAVIEAIKCDPTQAHHSEEFAGVVGVSLSRFRHLFCQQTGAAFRCFRAWKRARALMALLKVDANLTDIALNLGYADSTHFSHSIRRFYGLKPRDMFAGLERSPLALYFGIPYDTNSQEILESVA